MNHSGHIWVKDTGVTQLSLVNWDPGSWYLGAWRRTVSCIQTQRDRIMRTDLGEQVAAVE